MKASLAIVIPAYKGEFLTQTLDALVSQTVRTFNLYIGDDNSPDAIELIVQNYKGSISITYVKFEENVGGKSLTQHWQRCIDLVGDEEWVWLLPDDDVPSNDCVESFFKEMSDSYNKTALYRFQTIYINEHNVTLYKSLPHPTVESGIDFIVRKLKFECNSSVAEYIFNRKQFYLCGGFKDFPLAWCADDFLWYTITKESEIKTLKRGIVYLRQSHLNISNNKTLLIDDKINAKYLFLIELINDEVFKKVILSKYTIKQIRDIIAIHLFNEYKSYNLNLIQFNMLKLASRNQQLIGGSFIKNVYRLLRFQLKVIFTSL